MQLGFGRLGIETAAKALAAAAAAGCLASAPARATTLRYEVFWGGFHTAEVALVSDGGASVYHARLGIETVGLAESLSGLTVRAESWGRASGADLAPLRFNADTQGKDSENRLAVEFAPAAPARTVLDVTRRLTGAKGDDGDGDDGPRPPVPPDLRTGTLDPLSALMELGRRAMRAAAGQGPARFVVPVYDGHQRYDAVVIVKGPGRTAVDNRTLSGIAVDVRFSPLAGFRPDDLDFWRSARFTALIDPANGLPLHITSTDSTIATVINVEMPHAN